MSGVQSSKVSPTNIPTPKKNNFIGDGINIIRNIKHVIVAETVLGINRIFLLQYNKVVLYLTYPYIFTLFIFTIAYSAQHDVRSASHAVIKQCQCFEYLILICIAMFTNKKKFMKLFQNLSKFDAILNISKDTNATNFTFRGTIWVAVCILYMIVDLLLVTNYLSVSYDHYMLFSYAMVLAHDSELIFFCTLLRIIFLRLCIIKAHVAKVFGEDEKATNNGERLNKVEALSNNAQLDISSLHKVYELLHKCSEQLNSIMSFPMMIMLFTSGLSTTMLLRNAVKIIQLTHADTSIAKSSLLYVIIRCIKYTLLVVVPCYYSSITAKQVSYIRTMLHDAVNTISQDKITRRKIKAFFQLTKENEFTYAIWGVIRLNMTLPLSYLSLCTTYLVIIIQFSKFID